MKECKNSTRYLSNLFFGEISDEEKKKVREHIKACEYCLSRYELYKKTLDIMNLKMRKEPEKSFWNNYWERLTERYPEFKERKIEHFAEKFKEFFPFNCPAIVRAATAVSLIVVGIIIGKYFFTPEEELSRMETVSVIPSSPVIQKANEYLETSKVILVGIMNLNGELQERDFSLERQASSKLIEDARFIKANLGNSEKERRLRELVEDLEIILLEIANLSDEKGFEYVKFLTEGIKEKDILFKIRIYDMTKNKIGEIKYES